MDTAKKDSLIVYASIFLTGAAVLVLEVAATRILSPYYGNTIYTVSSVIGVVLAALAVGYWVGGKLADRSPTMSHFFTVILFGGLATTLVFGAVIAVLPVGGYLFSLSTGPLAWSFILFALPAFLLAMLSPLAITILNKDRGELGIGTVAGRAFFWSTAGSITGSFSTGFFLIPSLGIRTTLFLLSGGLIMMGVAGLFAYEKKQRSRAIFGMFIIALIAGWYLIGSGSFFDVDGEKTLYRTDGLYEQLRVADRTYKGRPARFFYQDRSSSGAMFLDGDDLAFDYTRYFALVRLFDAEPERTLFIGGGAYSMPKEMLRTSTSTIIETVEIEPSLPELAKTYFELPDSPRMTHAIADGRRYLHDATERYDLIYSDVYYSLYSIPSHFVTKEFFTLARSRLSDDGIFIANLIGRVGENEDSFIASEWKTFREVFPDAHIFAVEHPDDLGAIQNFVILGTTGARQTDLKALAAKAGVKDPFFAEALAHEVTIAESEIARAIILTDDRAPTDLLIAKMIAPKQKAESAPKTAENSSNETPLLNMVKAQLDLGPRHIGTKGHDALAALIAGWLKETGATVVTDRWTETLPSGAYTLTNVMGRINPDAKRRIILGAHYDTKGYAEEEKSKAPVPGANDGASGVAVLFALAHELAGLSGPTGVDLVFFDGEEHDPTGSTRSAAWHPLGSKRFAEKIATYYPNGKPEAAVVIDMVCDKDLHFVRDEFSMKHARNVTDALWKIGGTVAPDAFNGTKTVAISDDHISLQNVGIPAALIIDYGYDAWHTTRDTIDQCSEESMAIVLETLTQYVHTYPGAQ